MSLSKIRWGIIGLGKIAQKFAEDIRIVPDCELVAVASRSEEKASQFAEEFNAKYGFDSYAKLYHCQEVDVVYIATPHTLHHQNTMECLQHGKAVLCEKPFAMNEEQAQEMVNLARQKQLFLMEALWTRFIPSMKKVVELIENGAIGEIRSIQADFGFNAPFDPEKRIFNRKLGGGSLLDVGIYPVFLAMTLLGEPQRILADANKGKTGVDENCGILLHYDDGKMAVLHSSIVTDTPVEATINGDQGRIRIHPRWHQPTSLTLHRGSSHEETFHFPSEGNGYHYEIAEVNDCLRHGKQESRTWPLSATLSLNKTLDRIMKECSIEYPP